MVLDIIKTPISLPQKKRDLIDGHLSWTNVNTVVAKLKCLFLLDAAHVKEKAGLFFFVLRFFSGCES